MMTAVPHPGRLLPRRFARAAALLCTEPATFLRYLAGQGGVLAVYRADLARIEPPGGALAHIC